MKISKNGWIYIGVFAVIIVMCVATLSLVDGDFGGSDDSGGSAAEDFDYEPWTGDLFETIGFEMPGETESLLFAVQAAIGAFIIGYFVGLNSGKKKALAAADCCCKDDDCCCQDEAPAEEPAEAPAEEPAAEAAEPETAEVEE